MQEQHSSNWRPRRLGSLFDAGEPDRPAPVTAAPLWTAVGSASFLAAGLTKTAIGFLALCLLAFAAGAELTGLVTGASAAGLGAVALRLAGGRARPRGEATGKAAWAQGLDLAEAERLAGRDGRAETQLVALRDKQVLLSDHRDAFLMHARAGRRRVVLFDPAGPQAAWPALIDRFLRETEAEGLIPVFYQASPRLLAHLDPARFEAHKQGELAEVALQRFDMAGKDWASLRRAINRAARDGLSFELLRDPAAVRDHLGELEAVSEAWLAATGTGEKRFSLGSFTPDYLLRFPVAVVRSEGRIIAFANLLPGAPGTGLFIDLMRVLPGVHRGAMDFLMVRLCEELKAEGWQSLNLGLAPLSGLGTLDRPSRFERAGHWLFRRNRRLYHFAGLRAFKEKFDPRWSPRYLVVPKGTSAFTAALAIAVLIAGGVRGIFTR